MRQIDTGEGEAGRQADVDGRAPSEAGAGEEGPAVQYGNITFIVSPCVCVSACVCVCLRVSLCLCLCVPFSVSLCCRRMTKLHVLNYRAAAQVRANAS